MALGAGRSLARARAPARMYQGGVSGRARNPGQGGAVWPHQKLGRRRVSGNAGHWLLLQRGARPAMAVLADRTRGRQVRRAVLDMLPQYYAVHVTLDVWGRRERRRDIVPRITSFLVPPR